MEDMGVNPEAIVLQIDPSLCVAELKNKIIGTAQIQDKHDGYSVRREYTVSWPKCSDDSIDRVKILSRLLQKVDSIMLFLESLNDHTVQFNNDAEKQREFETSLESLLLDNKA
jgi:hypothetical protein